MLLTLSLLLSGLALLGCADEEKGEDDRVFTVLLRDEENGAHYRFEIKQSECEEHQLPLIARWQESGKRITVSVEEDPQNMTPEQRKELLERSLALYARWEDDAEEMPSAGDGSEEDRDPAPNTPAPLPPEDGSSKDEDDPSVQTVTLRLKDAVSGREYSFSADVSAMDAKTKRLLSEQSQKGSLTLSVSKDVAQMTGEEKQALLARVIAKLAYVTPSVPKATVFVDAGHGYMNSYGVIDKGAGENTPYFALTGKYESDVNLAIALVLKEELELAGYKVIMSRESEVNESLHINDRARMIKNSGADFAVSVHCNSFDDPSVNGARVYWHSENGNADQSLALANALAQAINGAENTTNVTAKAYEGSYAVVRDVHIPSVLVETCFLTGNDDAQLVSDEAWAHRMARAIFNGIERHCA